MAVRTMSQHYNNNWLCYYYFGPHFFRQPAAAVHPTNFLFGTNTLQIRKYTNTQIPYKNTEHLIPKLNHVNSTSYRKNNNTIVFINKTHKLVGWAKWLLTQKLLAALKLLHQLWCGPVSRNSLLVLQPHSVLKKDRQKDNCVLYFLTH